VDMDIKRLDHLGIVAGVIKDLGLVEAIDKRLQKDTQNQENITPGEAIVGMIINGLGFSDRPLSLTPQFFETKALEVLFRPGVLASDFNRYKLGKSLEQAHDYGCERLFFELSSESCLKEKIDLKFNSEDTTSLSVTGEYAGDVDEHTIQITHGYSKDHRPDLKQIIHELLVSQDGGVPLMMKSWDGNASDNKIFTERSTMLIEHFQQSSMPRYLIADSKLYSEENAVNLNKLGYITRIPGTIKEEQQSIITAIAKNEWCQLNDENRYSVRYLEHYGISQRWIVVFSNKARQRASDTLNKAVKKERDKIESQLWHLSNKPFDCPHDAQQAAVDLVNKCRYHVISEQSVTKKNRHAGLGRPKKGIGPAQVEYFAHAGVIEDVDAIAARLDEKSCYVLGTNIDKSALTPEEVINAYKQQNTSIENMGFRFLKDPLFFVSSLFLKKPSRIMGLLMVMTLALLVYSIAQRRLRQALAMHNETLPNQINQPTKTPTMRWIFQLMDGLHFVTLNINGVTQKIIQGWTQIKQKIIRLMGKTVMQIYDLGDNVNLQLEGSSM
jgi:transposase